MKTCKLKTQEIVKLDISTNYNTYATVQIWQETMQQTHSLSKFMYNK